MRRGDIVIVQPYMHARNALKLYPSARAEQSREKERAGKESLIEENAAERGFVIGSRWYAMSLNVCIYSIYIIPTLIIILYAKSYSAFLNLFFV